MPTSQKPCEFERLENQLKIIGESKNEIHRMAEYSEDAYTVFEILNARGQPLTDFELLRNYLLKNTSTEEKKMSLRVWTKSRIY